MKLNNQCSSRKCKRTTLLDVLISKRSIAIQAVVAHSIEWKKTLSSYVCTVYIIYEKKVCTCITSHCNSLVTHVLAFYRNNVSRFFLPHMPIRVDVTACFQPIRCVCCIRVCQVVLSCTIQNCHICYSIYVSA